MKIWVDDIRPAPEGYIWCKSVNATIALIEHSYQIDVIDIDYDAGEYANDGGDYLKILDWLEVTGRCYPIHIHSMNPVGVENMRRIIRINRWREI